MSKIFYQDKAGNPPVLAAFVTFREVKGVMNDTLAALRANGISIISADAQRIIAANGSKFWVD